MKKEMILVLGILMLGISACAQDFEASRSAEQKKEFDQQILPDNIEPAEKYQAELLPSSSTPPFAEVKKQSEAECKELWEKLKRDASKVLKFNEGSIRVSFKNDVEFAEAVALLEKYNIEKKKIMVIFVQPNESEEQQFKNSRNIIGNVEEGKEIETACKILQESEVQGAYPEVTLGIVSQ